MSIVNAFTIDVEDYFQVSAFEQAVDRSDWEGFESRVTANTARILDLLERSNTRATFFVLGWVAERHPDIVRNIVARGHEIASHGYSHRLIYNQTPEEFRDETLRSRALLQDISGQPVAGYRGASYSITRKSLWALDILGELGFEYDSSIFPIRHDRYGIPDAPRFPHTLGLSNGSTLTEFPMSTFRLGGMKIPVSGGGYFRIFPYHWTRYGLKKINNSEGRPFIFYLHPWEVDPGQPRIEAGRLSRFRHYTNLARCENRLEQLLQTFRFATVSSVLEGYDLPAEPVSYADGTGDV